MRTLAVRSDRDGILTRITKLQAEMKPLWGRMTAPQMICHLIDSFEVGLGNKEASPANNLFTRTVMKWGALYLPMKWPQGVPTRPEVDQQIGGTPPGAFDIDRAALMDSVVRFAGDSTSCASSIHPTFGKMSHAAWMRWGYLHADHHLRQFGV